MPISLKDTGVLFGDTAPYSLSELYGEPFSGGTSAPASGTINLNTFNGKTPDTEASGTWTHIAVPWYRHNYVGPTIQSYWRINSRVGSDTSLNSHGATIESDWPSTISMSEGFLTPDDYSLLSGTANPSGGYYNIGVKNIDGTWVKTANQTS